MIDDQWNALGEDYELAYFRADACLGSPQSFSLEEKKQICADMEAGTAEVDAAMRADFESLPPEFRVKLLDMLCASGCESEEFLKDLLLGEAPTTSVISSDRFREATCQPWGRERSRPFLVPRRHSGGNGWRQAVLATTCFSTA